MNKYDAQYYKRYLNLIIEIDRIHDELTKKIASSVSAAEINEAERFLFKDHIALSKKADKYITTASTHILYSISGGITSVWRISNNKNDKLVDATFKSLKSVPKQLKSHNENALKAFNTGKIDGYTLSERVWNIKAGMKPEIEKAIDAALSSGQSAKSLAVEMKKYLNNPDALYRRIRDKHGNLKLSANALSYHPGTGVYRSAHKNAMRLARDVINKAYRESDYLRWQQNPSVIGYRIQNSNREHTVCDICKYYDEKVFPKDYHFEGFHIQCACTAIPILVNDDQFAKIQKAIMKGEEPPKFKQPKMPEEYKKK